MRVLALPLRGSPLFFEYLIFGKGLWIFVFLYFGKKENPAKPEKIVEKMDFGQSFYLAILENIEIPIGNRTLNTDAGTPAIFQ